MPTRTTTPYGDYIHGTPRWSRATYWGAWSRFDAWIPARPRTADDAGAGDHVHCADGSDDSPIYGGGYDATCASCYLGHAHTAAYHARRVTAHAAAVAAHAAQGAHRCD
jgi:hypothetical protein